MSESSILTGNLLSYRMQEQFYANSGVKYFTNFIHVTCVVVFICFSFVVAFCFHFFYLCFFFPVIGFVCVFVFAS